LARKFPPSHPNWSLQMSKKTERENARAARLEAVQAEQRRAARRRRAVIVAASVAVVALVAGGSWALIARNDSGASAKAPPSQVPLAGLQTYSGLARDHVTGPVLYPQTPPVGGKHSATWLNCGVYDAPVANENAVHSLEHGAIWITYRPGLPASQIAAIRSDVSGQRYGLVSPYPGLPAPVVASVWGKQLKLDSAADPRLRSFVDTYASGSQAPEPGGECTGGIGTPLP
jgi:hypothetical protein